MTWGVSCYSVCFKLQSWTKVNVAPTKKGTGHKQCKTLLKDHITGGPSPLCGFGFEAVFQLCGLKLNISVYIRIATFR